jgi:hypothetical protein
MAADPSDAVEFMRQANDADAQNRAQGMEALRFRYGAQWPAYASASRGLDRPQLTINETNTYIKKVTNAQRQQRPRGKASPVDSFADKKVAKIITGLGRHVEVNSDADNAYDTAFDFAATIGWGYWRVRADYVSEDSFNQDLYIDSINNPFCVSFDPNSKLPDGSDAERALITDLMRRETFKKEYPGAALQGFSANGQSNSDPEWVTDQDIRLAEYFHVERKAAKLVMLSNGIALFEDRLPRSEVLTAAGLFIQGDRQSFKRVVKWCKQTAFEILEEKELPGRWIPIVPVYWTSVMIDGKRVLRGLVYDAMDPQRMVNFWQTSITESIALAPKAKWLIAEGQDEGYVNEFKNANLSASPVLHYKTTGLDGREVPPPSRIQPEPPPTGAIEASFLASQNLSRVMGVFDPAVRGGAQHKSDKTLNAERSQSENTNFDGYDNLTRSIKHTWRIMLSYFPVVFDTQRVQRIIGEDGREEMITLNQKTQGQDEQGNAIATVLNDITAGTYDVVMQTGPSYDTKRQEGVASMLELLNTPLGEKIAVTGDDLIVREMDFNGAEMLADRLAAANPLAQVDEKSDIPPRAQMQIKALQQQLEQAGQAVQQLQTELRLRGGIEQMKQDAETKRELMRTTVKAHENEAWQQEEREQVQSVERTRMHESAADNQTKILVEEIKAHVALLLAKIDERSEDKAREGAERSATQ